MKKSLKKIGKYTQPNSKKVFKNKKEATVVNKTISFYGAELNVYVTNQYRSNFFKMHDVTMADERIVKLSERNVECTVDEHLISIDIKRKKRHTYGGFADELPKKLLSKFPVIFSYDDKGNFCGLDILLESRRKKK